MILLKNDRMNCIVTSYRTQIRKRCLMVSNRHTKLVLILGWKVPCPALLYTCKQIFLRHGRRSGDWFTILNWKTLSEIVYYTHRVNNNSEYRIYLTYLLQYFHKKCAYIDDIIFIKF